MSNIPSQANVIDLYGNWLNGIGKKNKAIIHVGLCVLVWTIKNCRNGLVFNRVSTLQVIHMADSLIDMWSYLIPVKHREPINYGCNRKMAVVRLY
jgi:hypothetical protein